MASLHDKTEEPARASFDEKPGLHGQTQTKEVAAASVALAAAVAEHKPSMLSAGMIKLWMIMGIGYLVSTMNGYGMYTAASTVDQTG
jgi:hypothetical protein